VTLTSAQLAAIAAVASVISPPIVAFLAKEPWAAWVKQLLSLLVCIGATFVGLAIAGTAFSVQNITYLVGLGYLGSQVVYQAYFRHSVVETTLTNVGSKPKVVPASSVVVAPEAVPVIVTPTP
jgi:hypothetical protein